MKYTDEQLRHLDELAHTKLLNLPESKLGERCPNCGGETRLGINRAWCFNESEWIYSPYPEYTESLDVAFRLDKAEWLWRFTEHHDFLSMSLVEITNSFGVPLASIFINWADFSTKQAAYACGRTLCALKVAGVEVDSILTEKAIG